MNVSSRLITDRADVQDPPTLVNASAVSSQCTAQTTVLLLSVLFHKTMLSLDELSPALHCTKHLEQSLLNIVTAADSMASFKSTLTSHLFNQTLDYMFCIAKYNVNM